MTSFSEFLAKQTGALLANAIGSIEDLDAEQTNFRPHEDTNAIGFEAWHIARTVDNIVHFVFEREQPVWTAQGLHEAWGLPKVDQGTGMAPGDAHALRFPDGAALAGYCRAVSEAVVPRIEKMSDEYLGETMQIRPFGEMKRADIIGQVVISHGNMHVGQMAPSRAMLGKAGLGF